MKTPDTTKAVPSAPKQRLFSPKSTAAEAQRYRMLEALRSGLKTTDELRALGCYQVSARIFDLRCAGHNIVTELFDGYATDGYSHTRLGRYRLIEDVEITPEN